MRTGRKQSWPPVQTNRHRPEMSGKRMIHSRTSRYFPIPCSQPNLGLSSPFITVVNTERRWMTYWRRGGVGKSLPGAGKSTGLLRPMDDHDHDRILTFLYATETGGAQDAANKIARRCRNLDFECRNINVRDYPLVRIVSHLLSDVRQNPVSLSDNGNVQSDLIHETLIIFIVSTTGSGQEPRSMTTLWNMLLRSDLPDDILEDDLGQRYVISSNELSDLGYRLTAMIALS